MQDKNNIPLNLHCQINTYCPTKMLLQKVFTISYILIHLVCQFVTGLGKGVLCSHELSAIGRTVAADSK